MRIKKKMKKKFKEKQMCKGFGKMEEITDRERENERMKEMEIRERKDRKKKVTNRSEDKV